MIEIPFTSEPRLELIKLAIASTNAKTYLEIGCDRNQIFSQLSVEHMVGVDPARGGNVRMTSDDFFNQNTETFDVIFIDGLHTYDQVSKDVKNSLDCLNENGVIIIHDMLPRTEKMADPNTKCSKTWLGDVYRLSFDLANRTDVLFKLVLIDQGCGVLFKRPNTQNYNFEKANWNYYVNHWKKLPLTQFADILKI
jgi:predicted O-methyltransferase YrrM